jgi:lysophospholipase L1-like esterase
MVPSPRRSDARRRGCPVIWIGFGLVLLLGACSSDEPPPAPAASSAPASPSVASNDQVFTIVALGDSEATGAGDPTGEGWVGRYAALIEDEYGIDVTVENHAAEGKYSSTLLLEVESDDDLRQQLASADLVLMGIGGADLNIGDDALSSGTCDGKACYVPILNEFERNLDAIATEVDSVQGSGGEMRAVAFPNVYPGAEKVVPSFITPEIALYQATTLRDAICSTMEDHGGECIDALAEFNGPDGTKDAYEAGLLNLKDCCYPSEDGHQLIAELLLETTPSLDSLDQ